MSDGKHTINDMIQAVWRDGDLDSLGRYWSEDCVNHADADRRGLAPLTDYHLRFASSFEGFSDVAVSYLPRKK